jgi:anti-sigma B factor antagonist
MMGDQSACILSEVLEPVSLSIEVSTGKSAAVRVLRPSGPITLQNFTTLQAEFIKLQVPVTILDLSKVPHMDSAGLGAILKYYVAAQKRGHKLILAGVNDRVLDLFKLTRVNSLIPLAATVEQAESL